MKIKSKKWKMRTTLYKFYSKVGHGPGTLNQGDRNGFNVKEINYRPIENTEVFYLHRGMSH